MRPILVAASSITGVLFSLLALWAAAPGAAQVQDDPTADLGDAPDSLNAAGIPMTAYPGVEAAFPTVYNRGRIAGPRHLNGTILYYLGEGFSAEEEADTGYDLDPDHINNITPTLGLANLDGQDNGLIFPDHFIPCTDTAVNTIEFEVSLENTTASPIYFNLWIDWDRSGAWGGVGSSLCPEGREPPEWAVENQVVDLTIPGRYQITSKAFKAAASGGPVWVRASLSDQPAPADDGRGPEGGYNLGETEDMLFWQHYSLFLPILTGSGSPPPPPPPDIEDNLEMDLKLTLPQVPEGVPVVMPRDGLQFRLENRANISKTVELRLLTIINGEEYRSTYGPLTIQATSPITDSFPGLTSLPSPRFPAQFIVTAVEQPREAGQPEVHVGTEGYYFLHNDEGNPGQVVLYDELGLRAQTRTLSFLNAPAMSSHLQSHFGFLDTETDDILGLALYDSDDPDLLEAPILPDPMDVANSPSEDFFFLCPEWYVNLLDNNFGEDYGTVDDGWRARGALVSIYLDGVLSYNGQLNQSGCVTLPAPGGPADIVIYFAGAAWLQTDGNNTVFLLHYNSQASNTALAALTGIDNAQPNVVYRPEVPAWDGFGVLSYVIQERFNAGASGALFVYSDDCPGDSQNCSTTFNGAHALFLRPSNQNGWRRKFIAAHEWGHKLLGMTTSGTTNDCSFQVQGESTGHGMKTTEYSTCAVMEGWAHFVAAEAWNNPAEGDNPSANFVYWSGTVMNVEVGPDLAWCINGSWLSGFNQPSLCNFYGVELDWMRQWWDFRTNDTPSSPGFRPSHNYLKTIIDMAAFAGGEYDLSGAIQDVLSDPEMLDRWVSYGCVNGIHTFGCN